MGQIIRENLHDDQAEQLISDYCQTHEITVADKFTAMTLADLAVLHAAAIVGLGITASQLDTWQIQRKLVWGNDNAKFTRRVQ